MKKIIFLFILSLVFVGCKKAMIDKKLATNDRYANFDYLWEQVDKKYSYFDVKNIDWNQIRTTYRAQIDPNMNDVAFFNLLKNMLNELKDDHTNLISPFDVSLYNFGSNYVPQFYEPLLDDLFPDIMRTGAFQHSMVPNENIGYIRMPSFGNSFSEATLDWILGNYMQTQGLIIDVRGNGGGYANSVGILLARFTNTKILAGYQQMRNGEAHSDFSAPSAIYISPAGNYYSKPVIVLTDGGSYSATTFFALCSKAFPNMRTLGEPTGGGGGLPNGGQLPNGWNYRFSITRLLDVNQQNYAESGVPADIPVAFNTSDLTQDELINAAIQALQ